jgi:flagellar export protein FliJ
VKKFKFPLARVMDFRRLQVRSEEIRLEGMYAELRALDTRGLALIHQKEKMERGLRAAPSVTGFDLELFATFREAMKLEESRVEMAQSACRKRIEGQLAVLTVKRRNLKLLEHLKDKRVEKWEKEMQQEIDHQAEEAFLAKWNRQK